MKSIESKLISIESKLKSILKKCWLELFRGAQKKNQLFSRPELFGGGALTLIRR